MPFERMPVDSGLQLFKHYLGIDRAEQARRLKVRARDLLAQWKVSPIGEVAASRNARAPTARPVSTFWKDLGACDQGFRKWDREKHAPCCRHGKSDVDGIHP